jgi:hypothetical protein
MKKTIFVFGILMAAVLLAPLAYAGSGSPSVPPGTPPYGVAVQSDAAGEKVTGVIIIRYYNPQGNYCNIHIVMRLRKGSILKTLSGEAPHIDLNDPVTSTQTAVTTVMKEQILKEFFDDNQSLGIKMKLLDEYGEADFPSTGNWESSYTVADIVLAVK